MHFSRICSSDVLLRTRNTAVKNYLKRQVNDEFGKLAKEHSYRARSAFKLLEIQEKVGLFRTGNTVLDVGAAPGSWSQVAYECVGASGCVIGVDLQPIAPLKGVEFLVRADIRDPNVQQAVTNKLHGRIVDCIISDMAPSSKSVDHIRIVELCRIVLDLVDPKKGPAIQTSPGAAFLCKIWDGCQRDALAKDVQRIFGPTKFMKPKASRENSGEMFIYAKRLVK